MDAALIAHQNRDPAAGLSRINKWEILRQLTVARKSYGLSDRDLGVLRGLLSFYPETELTAEQLVVHPSNRAMSERLNGMPLSTLRRHIARLVETGFLIRRDSPNGKRFLRRALTGTQAFGFDLSPLLTRAREIITEAEAITRAEAELAQLRLSVSLMRRDLAALARHGALEASHRLNWEAMLELAESAGRVQRRKADRESLLDAKAKLEAALRLVHQAFGLVESAKMSTSDSEIEPHHQNSRKDSDESDARLVETEAQQTRPDMAEKREGAKSTAPALPNTPLPLVLERCREVQSYAAHPIRSWHQLVETAQIVRPMMGISGDVWQRALKVLGAEEAAVVLATMLERFSEIRSPGAYLRRLCDKALAGAFSSGPMLRALVNRAG